MVRLRWRSGGGCLAIPFRRAATRGQPVHEPRTNRAALPVSRVAGAVRPYRRRAPRLGTTHGAAGTAGLEGLIRHDERADRDLRNSGPATSQSPYALPGKMLRARP